MTLNDFSSMFFSTNGRRTTMFVFDSEEELDLFINGEDDADVLFAIHSDYKLQYFVKPEFAEGEVRGFCALDKNRIAAWIEKNEKN